MDVRCGGMFKAGTVGTSYSSKNLKVIMSPDHHSLVPRGTV